jgi:2-polyprenyl-3-methyl-5-hydroxy-6-metoxy-1,4-benzoquinol methylase
MTEPYDVRDSYYPRYVSAFTSLDPARGPGGDERYWAWCDQHLWPSIRSVSKEEQVLELGCGDGATLEYLRRRGFTAARGVDISDEQIQLARLRHVPASVGDAFTVLQDLEREFAAILALDFIEHFTKAELAALLARIWTALKPGGTVLLRTPNGQGFLSGTVIYGDLTHLTILNPSSLSQALHVAGFVNVAITESTPVKQGYRGWARSIGWAVIRSTARLAYLVETGKHQFVWTENMVCVARRPP